MLSEKDVLYLREIHGTLYEATRNPYYYAMVQAYELVLGDEIPDSMKNADLDDLIYEYKKQKSLKSHR